MDQITGHNDQIGRVRGELTRGFRNEVRHLAIAIGEMVTEMEVGDVCNFHKAVVSFRPAQPPSVRGKTGEVRWKFSHERGTTGDSQFKGTSGVQLGDSQFKGTKRVQLN